MKRIIIAVILTLGFSFSLQAQQLRYFGFGLRVFEPGPGPFFTKFVAATRDTDVISTVLQQLALPEQERNMHINGKIADGTSYNLQQWSWHFIPNEWILAENSIEVCDGNPIDIENDKTYWLETVGRFCPWHSYVLEEIFPSDVGDDNIGKALIFPNPSDGAFRIGCPNEEQIDVSIYDITGRLVFNKVISDTNALVETALNRGLYIINIKGAKINYFAQLFIK